MQVALDKIRAGRTTPDEVVQAVKADDGIRNCGACGGEVDERFHACPYCGAALRNDCPGCQAPLLEGWERCPNCGTLIAGRATEQVLEQRTMVVQLAAPKATSTSTD